MRGACFFRVAIALPCLFVILASGLSASGAIGDGLIAHYPFNGDAQDESTNANHGTVVGAMLTTDRFGAVGKAYDFNGSDAYISAPHQPYLNFPSGDFTVSLWAALDNPSLPSIFLGKDNGGGAKPKWFFVYGDVPNATGKHIAFHVNDSPSPPSELHWVPPVRWDAPVGEWHHYLLTKQGTNYKVQIDGQLMGNGPGVHPIPSGITADLTIGQAENGAFTDGKLDDVRIYNRALSDSESTNIFRSEFPGFVWEPKRSLPQTQHVNGARDFGFTALAGKIYLLGGLNHPNAISTVMAYDAATDTWTQKQDMIAARYAPAAASLAGRIYAIGGSGPSGVQATVEVFDPTSNTWQSRASMSHARFAYQAVALNGRIYALGGIGSGDAKLSSMEVYDPASNTWTTKASMPAARWSFAGVVADEKIYVVGGQTGGGLSSEVYEYDTVFDSWRVVGSGMPTPRETLAAVAINDRIITIGGSIAGGGGGDLVESFSATTGNWRNILGQPQNRNVAFAAIVGETLYLLGGYDQWSMEAAAIPHPVVVQQPTNTTILTGATAQFSAVATGLQPLSYQWSKDGRAIPGATNAVLTITNVQPHNIGDYRLTVTNAVARAVSEAALLEISGIPTFAWRGLTAYYPFSGAAQDATGNGHNGVVNGPLLAPDRHGAPTNSYRFDGIDDFIQVVETPANTNWGQQLFTVSAWIETDQTAGIQSIYRKDSEMVFALHTGNLLSDVFVSGQQKSKRDGRVVPVGQWHHVVSTWNGQTFAQYIDGDVDQSGTVNGPAVPSGNHPSLIGKSAPFGEHFNGRIDDLRIFNRVLDATEVANLYQLEQTPPPPIIDTHPTNLTVIVGNAAAFAVSMVATNADYHFQWLKNGIPIATATNRTLSITATQPSDAASYSAVVSAGTNSVASSNALLTVLIPPSVTTAPLPQTVRVGTTVSFAVSISGTGPFSYQWMLNGSNIVGATSSIFSVTNAQLTHGGGYSVRVSGPGGTVTSSPASLDISSIDMFSGVTVAGSVGAVYRIEYADVVGTQTNWVGLTNITLSAPRQVVIDFDSPGRQKRFYRIIRQP